LYAEGLLALQGEITKYIGVDALIDQPTLDPAYVSVKDSVAGVYPPQGKFTSTSTAELLEQWSRQALLEVAKVRTSDDASLMYEVADVKTWAHLGLHLASKLRGAVELQTYRTQGGDAHKQAAIDHLVRALAEWDEVIAITRPIYKDMPLTHYNHNSFDANPDNLFHWALLRDQVANDVAVAKNAVPPKAP
jgi:hypothetical protein